jgi:DNA-binding transcriptional MerR regulator
MAAHYRIGEFADLGGVSPKTLRFYDEIGLLRPAGVNSRTHYRRYVPQQLEDLAAIRALREMGASLAEIRDLRKSGSTAQRRKILSTLKDSAQQSIEAASKVLDWVTAEIEDMDRSERPIPVVVKRRPPVWIASNRARVNTYAEIERFERELLSAVPSDAIGALRGTLWHSCSDADFLEGEPFVAVKHALPAKGAFDLRQLPAATLACAYSKTDDRSAELAYLAIRKWMQVRGYKLAGPKREIYLDQLLEIQFPLKSA